MVQNKTTRLTIIALLMLTTGLLTGCANDADQGQLVAANKEDMQKRAADNKRRIQNDPNMSPQLKAAALNSIAESERKAKMMQAYRDSHQTAH